jgi:hypothetical protein
MNQADISHAIKAGDRKRLLQLGVEDPVQTLAFIDGSMRGLIFGPGEPDWIAAPESIDVILRRWLGSRDAKLRVNVTERDVDVAILRGAYLHGDLFLVAGAGISKGAGISEWKELVLKVLRSILDLGSAEQRSRVAEGIRKSLSFAPATAEEKVNEALADLTPPARELRQAAEDALRRLTRLSDYTSADLLAATETAKKALGARYFDHLKGLLYFGHQVHLTEAHRAIARLVHPKGTNAPPAFFPSSRTILTIWSRKRSGSRGTVAGRGVQPTGSGFTKTITTTPTRRRLMSTMFTATCRARCAARPDWISSSARRNTRWHTERTTALPSW